jgi:hypothetical protein
MNTPAVKLISNRKASAHAEKRRMRHRVAEIGHAPPDDEAAERPRGQREPDTGDERAREEIIEHGRLPRGMMGVPVVMVAVARVAMFGDRAVLVQHAAVRQMRMVVMMPVDRQRLGRACAEEFLVFGAGDDRIRRAAAADMAVEADHRVGVGHHHMQIVRDHQDAAAGAIANLADEIVERHLAGEIDALYGLVEDEKVGLAQDRAGKQRALELAARQRLHLGFGEMRYAD